MKAEKSSMLPRAWKNKRLKYVTNHIGSGKTPTGGATAYVDEGIVFIRSQNVYDDGLRLDDVVFIPPEVDEEMAGSRVQAGDVLLNITGASIGRSCIAPDTLGRANVNQHVCIIRPEDAHASRWIAAFATSLVMKGQIDQSQDGAGREGLNFEQIGNMEVSIPPLDVQSEVLTFLDRETTRLDALIAKKTRFIDLLREKRQALITQAVTKGLDPAVPMKDSGIEWLGMVPAHWSVRPLKYLVDFRSGGTPNKDNRDYWDGDVPWASAKDLKVDLLIDTQDHVTAHAIETGAASTVPVGSVLVVVRGMILARYFPVTLVGAEMAINQDLKALIPRDGISTDFLAWLLRGTASPTLSRLEEAGHGTKALRMESWVDIELPIPPITEQLKITDHIRRLTGSIDGLVERTERSIVFLKERRAALITAAVTGQIDVASAA